MSGDKSELLGKYGAVFDPSYVFLRQYVRVGGLESDLHVLPAMEFHADTSELIQMLRKGHHGVQLDPDAWERLVTWIDLNAPCHGTWAEVTRIPPKQRERRMELRQLYGGVTEDWEEAPEAAPTSPGLVMPQPVKRDRSPTPQLTGWPFDADEAKSRQAGSGPTTRTVDLGEGITMRFVRIPAGSFVMGDPAGAADEQPLSVVKVARDFWMAEHEVSNEQFRRYDQAHDSRFEHRTSWIFSEEYLGWPLNKPRQPVVRVSWDQAAQFCQWLSQKTRLNITLPTEAQWEYACRAGSDQPLAYGGLDTDFSPHANMADAQMRKLADEGWRPKSPDLVPRDNRFDDGCLVTSEIGRYRPNTWGLYDMHGNVAEWTRSAFHPYPYEAQRDDDPQKTGDVMVVRGGSWRDRPSRCRSAFRLSYSAYQKVFNVGFRVIIEDNDSKVAAR
jgi:formylglycine-generating enzyme required for sulfatase activity